MEKPPKPIPTDPRERFRRVKAAGLNSRYFRQGDLALGILPLGERIAQLLDHLQKHQPQNDRAMLFFIMYDIEDHRIRRHIAKYLQRKGCVRMQKSVFLGSGPDKLFREMAEALRDINSMYANKDSIMLFPVSTDIMNQLNMIGQNVDFKMTVAPPNVLII